MDFTDTMKTLTREGIVPKVYDTVLNGNVGVLRSMGNAKTWGSGYRKDIIFKYQKSTVGGLVGLGGTLDTDRSNTRAKMQFSPKRRHVPVVIDDIEQELNKGDEQVLMLLATEMDSLAQDLLDTVGTDLYEGNGTGNEFDSIENAADDATNYATYGGQARATYTTLAGYLVTGVGTLALSEMSTAWNSIKVGSSKPSLALADVTAWTAYEGLLQPTIAANYSANGFPQVTRTGQVASRRALGGDSGFDSIFYRGTPIVEDEKCPSGEVKILNENYFHFYGIDISKYEKINIKGKVDGPQNVPVPRGFNWSGMGNSNVQPGEVGHMYIIGNWISEDPRRLGSMEGITG